MYTTLSRRLFCTLLLTVLVARVDAQELRSQALELIPGKILLPAPPSVGSDECKAEVAEVLALQAARTDDQIKQFQAQEKLGPGAFKDVMPDWFEPVKLPKLEKLFKTTLKEAGAPIDSAKSFFKRDRPFREDCRIQPLGPRENDFSYPSGHATRGILYAQILAQIDPERAAALMERGRQIGWNRVIGGMHHPSDVAAGRVLGQAIARSLLGNPDFKAELEEVKQEYETAKKDHAATAPTVGR